MNAKEARKKGNASLENSQLSEYTEIMRLIENDVSSNNPKFVIKRTQLEEWTKHKLKDLGYSIRLHRINDPREIESYYLISW